MTTTPTPETDAKLATVAQRTGNFLEEMVFASFARTLERQRDSLAKERDHWKTNHDNACEIRRAVLTRPDLGERAPYVVKIAAERDAAFARVKALQEALGLLLETSMDMATRHSDAKHLMARKNAVETLKQTDA